MLPRFRPGSITAPVTRSTLPGFLCLFQRTSTPLPPPFSKQRFQRRPRYRSVRPTVTQAHAHDSPGSALGTKHEFFFPLQGRGGARTSQGGNVTRLRQTVHTRGRHSARLHPSLSPLEHRSPSRRHSGPGNLLRTLVGRRKIRLAVYFAASPAAAPESPHPTPARVMARDPHRPWPFLSSAPGAAPGPTSAARRPLSDPLARGNEVNFPPPGFRFA